jgi:hypothetical protein
MDANSHNGIGKIKRAIYNLAPQKISPASRNYKTERKNKTFKNREQYTAHTIPHFPPRNRTLLRTHIVPVHPYVRVPRSACSTDSALQMRARA